MSVYLGCPFGGTRNLSPTSYRVRQVVEKGPGGGRGEEGRVSPRVGSVRVPSIL